MAEGGGLRAPGNFLKQLSSSNPSEASRSWTNWLQQYDFYMIASEKNEKSEEVQVATLLTLLGEEGQELFRTFTLSDTDRKKISNVKEAFTNHFAPRVKEEFERFKFYGRIQSRNEPFDSFLTSIQALITTCNFHTDERDKALRDRIVFGIQSTSVREELFNVEGALTLQKCVQVCQRAEATKQYLHHMDRHETSSNTQQSADAIADNKSTITNPKVRDDITNCKYCGGTHQPRRCPAYGKECKNCKRANHYARVCQSTKSGKNIQISTASSDMPAIAAAHEIFAKSEDLSYAVNPQKNAKEWYIDAKCNNKDIRLKIDTGASCNVMPKAIFESLSVPKTKLTRHKGTLSSFSGHELSIVGNVSLMLERDRRFSVHDFVIVDQG